MQYRHVLLSEDDDDALGNAGSGGCIDALPLLHEPP
jgi:hypothetical protein